MENNDQPAPEQPEKLPAQPGKDAQGGAMDGSADESVKADDPVRDEKGRIRKGHTLNPKGRPKGRGFMDKLRAKLKEKIEVKQRNPETGEMEVVKVEAVDVVVDNFVKMLIKGNKFHLREYLDREEPKPKRIDIITKTGDGPRLLKLPAGGLSQQLGLFGQDADEDYDA